MPDQRVAESSVRRYVERAEDARLGLIATGDVRSADLRLGQEAQVDWYEAYADLGGERCKMQVFCMRSMASGGAFHRAYPRATQQAFLEAHEVAFAYFSVACSGCCGTTT